ncbi:hypothetical protein GCM10009117_10400 [Gangjinia marincola]|uniref:Sensor of ECF-type sigma factor n=1 Tax=Gangjinia marincola TaxID=578463 RepID=A0ABN1MG43_9FLAO
MKKILIILFISLSLNAFAQQGRERINTMRIAYITQELALTPTEAEKFWPVYNAHSKRVQELRKKERETINDVQANLDEMSEKEAEKKLMLLLEVEEQKVTDRRDLVKNLKGVVSPNKIIRLFKAEDDFKRKLLKQYGNRRGNR